MRIGDVEVEIVSGGRFKLDAGGMFGVYGVVDAGAWFALRPTLYGVFSGWGVAMLRRLAGADGMIHKLPLGGGWTDERDMPAPAGRTFRALYRQRRKAGGR